MNGELINHFCADPGYKMRYMRSLEAQVKKDYGELNQLWAGFNNDKIGEIEFDELLKKISRVKQELNIFIELRNNDIEGVLWVDVEDIVKDLQVKENQITKIIRSVSDKKEI